MKFGYDNARRRIIKKYAKLFVVVYGGSGLFLFCLWAWICPFFALRALRCGLWACWPCLGPVWAPVFILFVARLCTCLFLTHRSFCNTLVSPSIYFPLSEAKQKSKSLTAIKKHARANRNIYTIQACRKIQQTLRPLFTLMICANLHHIALAPAD